MVCGEIRYAIRIGHVQIVYIVRRVDHLRDQRRFAQCADHFIVIAMADEDQRVAFTRELYRFHVNFGDQRTGRVDNPQLAQLAVLANFGRNAVCAVNHALAGGNFVHAVDKNGALGAQLIHHVAIVNDLFADIDGRAECFQRDADNVDGAHHSGAKAPRLQ